MFTRRSFLSALCALPVVGRFFPKQDTYPAGYADALKYYTAGRVDLDSLHPTPGLKHFATMPSTITDMQSINGRVFVTCGDRGYEVFEDGTYREI